MKFKFDFLSVLLVCFLALCIGSGCSNSAPEKIQSNIQDMPIRFEEIEKRLSSLEDIEAIKRLQNRYVNFLQKGNYENFEDIVAEEFVLVIGSGSPQKMTRKETGEFYRNSIGKDHNGNEGDLLVHPIIDLDGDKATANVVLYFMYYHPKTRQTLFFAQSWLDMDYVKESDGWKISGIKFIPNKGTKDPKGPPTEESLLNFLDQAQKTMQEMQQ